MKKIIFAIMAVMIAASVVLSGCSGSKNTSAGSAGTDNSSKEASAVTDNSSKETSAETDNSWNEIKEKGEFVVGLDDAFPPMGFRDESNNIVGFDIDLAKEAAKRLGVEVKFQPVNWDSVILELKNKNIDVIWNGMTITEDRKKEINFTKPYIEDRQILVVAKGSPIKSKKDLAGKKVGLQSGSSSKEALEKDTETLESIKEVVEFDDNTQALMALKTKRVDAVVVDEVVGRYYIAKDADSYEVLEDHFGFEEFGVGLRKEDLSFLNKLQEVLDEMKKDGTSAEISKKWFGEDIVK